jgi:hypothetical protein
MLAERCSREKTFVQRPIHRGELVMPTLLWVAFWSSMMGAAACWGEPRQSVRKTQISENTVKKSDLCSGD